MAAKKMTAEEILKEAQQKHSEIKNPTEEFGTQKGFQSAAQDDRERARIRLRDRYWDLREQINSMFDTKEAATVVNKWINSMLSEEMMFALSSTEKRGPSKNTLKGFEELHSQIEDLEVFLMTCQVAQELNGKGCRGELSYRLDQLRAVQEGKNPDEIEKTGDTHLYPSDDIVLGKVQEAIVAENKAKKEETKNISDSKKVK